MKNKKDKVMNYNITIKDSTSGKLKWVVCPHCAKPVYGTVDAGERYQPSEEVIKHWEWTAPDFKKKES